MYRQKRRRIKRLWEKRPCFSDCTNKVTIDHLPNTAVEFLLKISDDLLLRFNLDMFERWRLFPIVVVDGFFFQGFYINIGVASDWWLNMHFGIDDIDDWLWSLYDELVEEELENYAYRKMK